ncbi:MAG: hypothetical protein AAF566_06115 [Pseudomonadota bacterium]
MNRFRKSNHAARARDLKRAGPQPTARAIVSAVFSVPSGSES